MTDVQDPPAAEAPARRHELSRVVLYWALASVPGMVLAAVAMRAALRVAASPQARDQDFTLVLFTVVAVPVAFFVLTFVGYSLWRFRVRGKPDRDGPPLRGNPLANVAWPAISTGLCVFLIIWGLVAMTNVGSFGTPVAQSGMFGGGGTSARAAQFTVDVTGQQWMWTFRYPGQGGISSRTLVLPQGQPVQFAVTSTDVVHSFWSRALGAKIDAVPGEVTYTNATPTRLGTYSVRCVELCGLDHAYMQTTVRVVTPDQFAQWVAQQQASRAARG